MRIAFLNPQGNFDAADSHWTAHADFGGQLVYVKQVALAMADLGHQVDIITRRVKDPAWPEFAGDFDSYADGDGVRIVRLACGGDSFLRKEDLWPHLAQWVEQIIQFYGDNPPEAATAHYGDGGLAAALWRDRGGPAFTFTGHSLGAQKLDRLLAQGLAPDTLDTHYRFALRIAAERVAMSHAACVVTSTEQERREQYTHPAYTDASAAARFSVVPPGVNLAVFADVAGPDDERVRQFVETQLRRDLASERLGLPAIISASRLEPKKNHLGLVRAYAESPELRRAANLVLLVRGLSNLHDRTGLSPAEAEILDAIESLWHRHRLAGTVSLFSLSGQGELAAAYRHLRARRSVFVLTALYEPFGLAPLEAMATGLPGVVTRNGGPSESLVEGSRQYGVLVDPESPAAIAQGLLTVAADWERWQAAGRERVLRRYTWDRTAEGYLSVLAGLAAPQAPVTIPGWYVRPHEVPPPSLPQLFASSPEARDDR